MAKWDILLVESQQRAVGVDEEKVIKQILKGKLAPTDRVRETGSKEWLVVSKVQPFAAVFDGPQESVPAGVKFEKPKTTPSVDATEGGKKKEFAKGKDAKPAVVPYHEDDETPMQNKSHMELSEMDLTPMVDLTFLLNMFFILTTSYALLQTINVPPIPPDDPNKPKIENPPNPADTHIIVKVEPDNTYLVDDQPTQAENLVGRLNDTKNATQKKMLIVDCHADAQTDSIVRVIDAASAANMEKVKVPTKLRGQNDLK